MSTTIVSQNLVNLTSPTFSTSATTPLLIGGTTASSTLTLESTSGVGTSDSIIFKTGSQATALTINSAGLIGIGTSPVATNQLTIAKTVSTSPTDAEATIAATLTDTGTTAPLTAQRFPIYAKLIKTGSGTLGITDHYQNSAGWFETSVTGGTIDTLDVVNSRAGAGTGATITNLANFKADQQFVGTGTVTNRYGLQVLDLNQVSGLTSQYGLYVNSLTSGTSVNYAVFTAGTTPSQFGGKVTIPSGIVLATDTPLNSATTTNTTLSHYDEGTWTPAWGGSTGAPTVTYVAHVGTYTKIGRLVFARGYIAVSAFSGGSGVVEITGLPFTSANNTDAYVPVNFGPVSGLTFPASTTQLVAFVLPNTTYMIVEAVGSGQNETALSLTGIASTSYVAFSVTYEASN